MKIEWTACFRTGNETWGEALIWELMDFGGYEVGKCWEERMRGDCRTCFHSSNVVKLEWKVYYMGCLEFSLLVKSIFMCANTQLP